MLLLYLFAIVFQVPCPEYVFVFCICFVRAFAFIDLLRALLVVRIRFCLVVFMCERCIVCLSVLFGYLFVVLNFLEFFFPHPFKFVAFLVS